MSPRLFPRFIPSVLLASAALTAVFLAGCSSDDDDFGGSDYTPEPAADMRQAHREEFIRRAKGHVVVVVLADNRTWLNGSRVSPKNLPAKLAELGKRTPGTPVLLATQVGTNPDAGTFVELHARKAGLGAVEYFN